jgi:hypothetical protein
MNDPESRGVLCLEEPENGIHPVRIPAMIQLLRDICTDTDGPVGPDNPLRQVIVNTHSPAVVQQVDDDTLLVALIRESVSPDGRSEGVQFCYLDDTWRAKDAAAKGDICPKGKLLTYLNPVPLDGDKDSSAAEGLQHGAKRVHRARRLVDREDIRQLLLPMGDSE